MSSPYSGLCSHEWSRKTNDLISRHPLRTEEIVEVILSCWDSIFLTKIGGMAQIGVHIFPRPQVMGEFLHELIPFMLSERYPGTWRREEHAHEKDLGYTPHPYFSVEIKTSSHKSQIFGNRSYSQKPSTTKKAKSSYYIAINFEKFTKVEVQPEIVRIYFGWIDEDDWIGQAASTGQQAKLPNSIYGGKLLVIYTAGKK